VKTAKNSKLPKLPEKCFEPVGKSGWPLISIWIINQVNPTSNKKIVLNLLIVGLGGNLKTTMICRLLLSRFDISSHKILKTYFN
jgi:hypothetical protein